MRLLIIQAAGEHKENYIFRESLCLHRACFNNKIESAVWGVGYSHFEDFDRLCDWCDVVLCVENYFFDWIPDLSLKSNKLKIFWAIDGHCNYTNISNFVNKNNFDLILSSCYGTEFDIDTEWFLNCYPDDLIQPKSFQEKEIAFGYIGSIGNSVRQEYLKALKNKYNMLTNINIIGTEMVNILQNFKISFNVNLSTDINYRTFESMGAGCLLITNITPGIQYHFKDNNNIVLYNNMKECFEVVDHYLKNLDDAEIVANNGLLNVKNNHTYNTRVRELYDIIQRRS